MSHVKLKLAQPREYTALSEAATSWGVTVDDLLHQAVRGEIQVCASTNRVLTAFDREPALLEVRYLLEYQDPDEGRPEERGGGWTSVPFSEWQTRTTTDMPPGVFALRANELRCIARAVDRRWPIAEALRFLDGEWHLMYLPEPLELGVEDLCILAEEVRRIEATLLTPCLPAPVRGPAGDRPWPWGDHTTRALELLRAAAFHFWAGFEADKPEEAPTSKEVVAWLEAQGASAGLADSIARLLRADGLPAGPRPKSGVC